MAGKHDKPYLETGKAYKSDLEKFKSHGINLPPKDTLAIIDFFVPQEMRNTGIGSKMISEFIAKNKSKAIVLNVYPHEAEGGLNNEEFDSRQQKLIQFYSKFGFKAINNHWMYKLPNNKQAGLKEVIEKITKNVWDSDLNKRLIKKVTEFVKTKDKKFDLSNEEASKIYKHENYGKPIKLENGNKVNVDWTSHAEFRSDLRDVNPDKVNRFIKEELDKLHNQNQDKGNDRFKSPETGTVVMDYDIKRNPGNADVITVWSSERIARELIDIARTIQ